MAYIEEITKSNKNLLEDLRIKPNRDAPVKTSEPKLASNYDKKLLESFKTRPAFLLLKDPSVTPKILCTLLNDSDVQNNFLKPANRMELVGLSVKNKPYCEAILNSTICERDAGLKKEIEAMMVAIHEGEPCKTSATCKMK